MAEGNGFEGKCCQRLCGHSASHHHSQAMPAGLEAEPAQGSKAWLGPEARSPCSALSWQAVDCWFHVEAERLAWIQA